MRPITWNDDSSHFQPPSRRMFLQVGAVSGLGLTLDGFLRQQAARGDQSPSKEGTAKSVIYIYLPGGAAHQETFGPEAVCSRSNTAARWAAIEDQCRRRVHQRVPEANGQGRRQDRHLPLDDARRSGPRTRHAQHVHRLSAQPGVAVPSMRHGGQSRIRRRATICRRTFASPASRHLSPAPAI